MNWIAESKQRRQKKQAVQAIDVLLADKPDAFRTTVYELSRQLGWADDEPSFLLAIATNQLEALVKQYPERISKAMKEASAELVADWKKLQAQLSLTAVQATNTAIQIDQRLLRAKQLVDSQLGQVEQLLTRKQEAMLNAMADERAAMLVAMTQERDAVQQLLENERMALADERTAVQQLLSDERAAMAQRAQELTDQQKAVLVAQTNELIAEGITANQQRADNQVNAIVRAVRGKHYLEMALYAFLGAALLSSAAWMTAWVSRGRAEASSTWGDIERWNKDHLQACIEAQQATCSIHIEVPEHLVEQ